jgi:hypothetical protein
MTMIFRDWLDELADHRAASADKRPGQFRYDWNLSQAVIPDGAQRRSGTHATYWMLQHGSRIGAAHRPG